MIREATRRWVVLASGCRAATCAWPAQSSSLSEEPFSNEAAMMVPGPDGGRLDQVSRMLAAALVRALPAGCELKCVVAGGADGVTVANQFEARSEPDGRMLLMVPGAAVLAWLTGDARAHFQAGHWVPVMAGFSPAIVVGRLPPGGRAPGAPWRVAAVDPAGLTLPALLAVDLLGAQCVPVSGLADDAAAQAALARGEVDAVLVRGGNVAGQLAALDGIGAQPLFVLGTPGEDGKPGRDPLLPDTPTMAEFCGRLRGSEPSGPLYAAWCAAAAATQLYFAVVLPPLTTAGLVAVWRRAGAQAAVAPDVLTAVAGAFRPLASTAATVSVQAIRADPPAVLELRHWMAMRLNWHPG